MNNMLKKLLTGFGNKKSKQGTKKSARGNYIARQKKLQWIEKINKGRKNHVSETDLSPGGFPFHFAGYKKTVKL